MRCLPVGSDEVQRHLGQELESAVLLLGIQPLPDVTWRGEGGL
jgi:hypothetical protein